MKKNYRPTWAEIDLTAIKDNFHQVKKHVGKATKVLVAVKANAYSHGLIEVSKVLESAGVDYLGVASVDEAVALRDSQIKVPILVFGSILPSEVEAVLDYDLTQTLCSLEIAKILDAQAKKKGKLVKVHLKVDTGMGRLGIWYSQAEALIKKLTPFKNIELEGIYTHFPSADEEDPGFTRGQIGCFRSLLKSLETQSINILYKHAANSMATVRYRDSHFNLVRPGLMIYGVHLKGESIGGLKFKPALSLKSRITYLKKTPPGRSIGYGRTFITAEQTAIATVAIGYGDGYTHFLSNKAEVLVKGKRVKVVGRISMDQITIDVGKIKGVELGDEVVLIGKQGEEEVKTEELAAFCGTIPYEILCWISARVPRIYKTST